MKINVEYLIQWFEKQGHTFTATLEGLIIQPEPTGDNRELFLECYWLIYRHFFREMVHEKASEAIKRLQDLLPLYPDQREQFARMAKGVVVLGATFEEAEIELFYDRAVEFIDAVTTLEEYHETHGQRDGGEVH